MVVRETVQMAESLVHPADLVHVSVPPHVSVHDALTVDVDVDGLDDGAVTTTTTLRGHSHSHSDVPTYQVKQGDTTLSSQNLAALTTGLKIMTSLGSGQFVSSLKTTCVDGLSASSRRSEDDDGYCSRSSLDSPVQLSRLDVTTAATDDSVDATPGATTALVNGPPLACRSCVSPPPLTLPSSTGDPSQSCDGGGEDAHDELREDRNSGSVAAVASLDHCYLMAGASDAKLQAASPVSVAQCTPPPHSNTDTESAKPTPQDTPSSSRSLLSSASLAPRNISIFVVPQPSTGLRWRARIIRATDDATGQVTSAAAAVAAAVNRQGSTAVSTSWLPLSTVTNVDGGTVKSTRGTSVSTQGRRWGAYRPQQQQQHRIAAGPRLTRTSGGRGRERGGSAAAAPVADYELRRDRLHPLVDHDYGAFATFNAEVQSSIISTTTDGVTLLDLRSIRRHRGTTSASTRHAVKHSSNIVAVAQARRIRQDVDARPKRKYCRRQSNTDRLLYEVGGGRVSGAKPGRKGRPPSSVNDATTRRQQVSRKRPLQHDAVAADDGKTYVKIPGQYQDDFVYYATKRARGRPRKSLPPDAIVSSVCQGSASISSSGGSGHAVASRPSAVASINVFDWYREMAETDKSRRFGVHTATTTTGGSDTEGRRAEACPAWADTTPVDESAVADLVMDMLPSSSASASVSTDYNVTSCVGAGERSELTVSDDDVCAMLRSLNEADLKMIESHLTVDATAKHGSFDKVDVDTGR